MTRLEDSRGCERARGEDDTCDLACPNDASVLPMVCACDREDFRIRADFSGCEPQAGWTILVYMHADNDLEDYSLEDVAEMARGLLPFAQDGQDFLLDVNLIIQIDRSQLRRDSTLRPR